MVRVEGAADPGNLDPAAQGTWVDPQLAHLTCAGLMGYPDGPSPGGSRLIPEVAQAAPTVSRDGRSYTFIVRRGYRFSPPSGAPVTAHTFKYTIYRSLSPRLDAPNTPDMRDVVGMSAYAAGRAAHVSGVIARGDELTIVLRRPSGSLPARIGSHAFCPVPIGTPINPRRGDTIAYAGPYYISLLQAERERDLPARRASAGRAGGSVRCAPWEEIP